jgi:1-deoxy-D-xylulose-5-phosphate synthase
MLEGTGLSEFSERFPDRFFDVGIAEEHAAAMCAGMAKQGLRPVFAVYSTFLQRAYDMLIHDVALQKLHVVFCIDRSGLVSGDGETHQGVFDLAMLRTVPHMTVLAPASFAEMESMLRQGVEELDGPVAIRYPRGGQSEYVEDHSQEAVSILRQGSSITLVSYGIMINEVLAAAARLEQEGLQPEVIKANRLIPLDAQPILNSVRKTGRLLVAEDVISCGSLGHILEEQLAEQSITAQIMLLDAGMEFIHHGSVPQLRAMCGIDWEHIAQKAREACGIG